jgi:hypothetical protein
MSVLVTLRELERSAILVALEHANGVQLVAAKALGISARMLSHKIHRVHKLPLFRPSAVEEYNDAEWEPEPQVPPRATVALEEPVRKFVRALILGIPPES